MLFINYNYDKLTKIKFFVYLVNVESNYLVFNDILKYFLKLNSFRLFYDILLILKLKNSKFRHFHNNKI